MTTPADRTTYPGLFFLLCPSLALIFYSRTLTSYFLSDDFVLVGNVAIHGFSLRPTHFVRPTVVLAYLADFSVWGLNPVGYHLTNVLLHTLNAALIGALTAALLRALGSEATRPAPALAAVAFLALPSHTESVTWISGRADLLASLFMLLALLSHLTFLDTRRHRFRMFSLAAFSLALLSKESAVAFPAVVAVLTLALTRRPRIVLSSTASLLGVLAGYAILRRLLLGHFVAGYGTDAHLAWNAERVVLHIAAASARVLLPPLPSPVVDLLARNWYMSPRRWLGLSVGASVLVVLVVALFRTRSSGTNWQLSVALVASFWLSLPLLGRLEVSLADTQGERFLYFPSVFVVTAIVCFAAHIPRHSRLVTIGIGAWILASSVALWQLNATWAAAGGLSDSLATETATLAEGGVVVVTNVPDNYRGAYVFRNGFAEAITIFRHPVPPVERVDVLSTHPIRWFQEEVTVRKAGAGWSVQFPGNVQPAIRVAPDVAILSRSPHGFAFELLSTDAEVLSYSAGRMRRVTR
jgi:hypothetical protein